ncbi:MAG: hypothetical protein WAS56_01825 [Saprospiraceae bacterium]|jgi:hypothetical protein|nr:hypothetical protein [Saprospiraceae bacterium]MBK9995092.1 hypothetical protein [Saprospiraceae bacterium]
MKLKFLSLLSICAILAFASCKNEPKASTTDQNATAPAAAPANTANPVATPPNFTPTTAPTPEPAQNAKGVWHFTCPKGCAGGSGAAGPCGKCGEQLTHNTAYHQ